MTHGTLETVCTMMMMMIIIIVISLPIHGICEYKHLLCQILHTHIQCESTPPPCGFQTFFPNGWEFLINFLHTYYAFISTLDYKFLFNYLQLWRSYAIL